MSKTNYPENKENIDWQSLLVNATPSIRNRVARDLGIRYEMYVEDVVSDTLVRFLTHIDSLKNLQSEESGRIYLFKIAHNLAIERLRELRKFEVSGDDVELLEDERAQVSIENAVYDHEMEEQLLKVGGVYTEHERLILRLYLSGHSAAEMAELLGVEAYSVRYELNKLLAKIRYRIHKGQKANK